MKKRLFPIAFLLVVVMTALMPVTVSAYVEELESMSMSNQYAYRHLAEDDDILVVFHYNVAFTSDNYSTIPASRSLEFRLLAANGTLLQTTSPYVFPSFESNGYGQGVGAFYLSADNAPTWGEALTVYINQKPGFFETTDNISYTFTASDFSEETDQDGNRDELKDYILDQCDDLDASYADQNLDMKASSDTGIVLGPDGEGYFRGVIDGLQTLCPELFFVQTLVPTILPVTTYNMTLQDTYTGRLTTDDLGEGFTNTADLFNMAPDVFWPALILVVIIGVEIWARTKGKPTGIGIVLGLVMTGALAVTIGGAIFVISVVGAFVGGIVVVWFLILKRS